MAKYAAEVAVAFAPQVAEGTYNSDLAAITTSIEGDPDPAGVDDGLLLGDPGSGFKESGLTLVYGRDRAEKAVVGSSFTRPLADLEKLQIDSFTFAFPFCGDRFLHPAPADALLAPLKGIDALLNGCGLLGVDHPSVTGFSYKFDQAAVFPFSALVFFNGARSELLDCRCNSFSAVYTPGQIVIATVDVSVGTVREPAPADVPLSATLFPTTVDYHEQASVNAPTVEGVGNFWNVERGFNALTWTITPNVLTVGDSNVPITGEVKAIDGRVTTIDMTIFGDDAGEGEVFELEQLLATAVGDLEQLSYQVGVDATASVPAKAHQIIAPQPEVVSFEPTNIGDKAGAIVSLVLGNDVAKEEFEIVFR